MVLNYGCNCDYAAKCDIAAKCKQTYAVAIADVLPLHSLQSYVKNLQMPKYESSCPSLTLFTWFQMHLDITNLMSL